MGIYIETPNTKREWLFENATALGQIPPNWNSRASGEVYIWWVHNGDFDAGLVVYSKDEYYRLSHPGAAAGRRYFWFAIQKEKLKEVIGDSNFKYIDALP